MLEAGSRVAAAGLVFLLYISILLVSSVFVGVMLYNMYHPTKTVSRAGITYAARVISYHSYASLG